MNIDLRLFYLRRQKCVGKCVSASFDLFIWFTFRYMYVSCAFSSGIDSISHSHGHLVNRKSFMVIRRIDLNEMESRNLFIG